MTPVTAALLMVISVLLTTGAIILNLPWAAVLFASISLYMAGECLAIGYNEVNARRKKGKRNA